jgi:tRNA(Ile)-lysidine synthase
MIKITVPLPKQITIACSGGVDSMAIVDFLSRKHDVTIAHFNHGTQHGKKAAEFVAKYCTDNNIPMIVGHCVTEKCNTLSQEEYWRNERYRFFKGLGPVITCHHLDDCVETYIWSALNGTPKVIPLTRNNVLRPFLTTRKQDFVYWCESHNVPWIEDESNKNSRYTRNYIRNELMPHALRVNPGLHTLVKKIVEGKQNT